MFNLQSLIPFCSIRNTPHFVIITIPKLSYFKNIEVLHFEHEFETEI